MDSKLTRRGFLGTAAAIAGAIALPRQVAAIAAPPALPTLDSLTNDISALFPLGPETTSSCAATGELVNKFCNGVPWAQGALMPTWSATPTEAIAATLPNFYKYLAENGIEPLRWGSRNYRLFWRCKPELGQWDGKFFVRMRLLVSDKHDDCGSFSKDNTVVWKITRDMFESTKAWKIKIY